MKSEKTGEDRKAHRTKQVKKSFVSRIRKIIQIPGKILKTLKNFQLTAEHICAKIKNIKIFLENEKFKRGKSLIFQEARKLLAHGSPRKIKGSIKLGTEDPCLTGEILERQAYFILCMGKILT